ncbi:hypothetical protein H4R34_001198 [Dimargaris verticillata]|uniref:C3H1-type domain-containing protein n=1 Tax=Dimargaris verticillata TaxID=2761393 RepID=A0A9W8EAJ5_9FUNG|nr:hypothetical protein H4R34_001198 [Dimargaris verticillata]
MPVCKFFLQNRCAYGDRCKFEHPRNHGNSQFGQSGFGSGGFNRNSRSGGFSGPGPAVDKPGAPTATTIENDLKNHQMMWPYSCYGPEKNYPNLISDADMSFEELRVEYYACRKMDGNDFRYVNSLPALAQKVESQIQSLSRSYSASAQLAISRYDKARQESQQPGAASAGGGAFGTAAPAPAFGQPSFGTAAPMSQQQSLGGFGGASAFGASALQSTAPAFGGATAPAANRFGALAGSTAAPPPAAGFGALPGASAALPTAGSTGFGAMGGSAPISSAFGNPPAPAAFSGGGGGRLPPNSNPTRSQAPPHDYSPEELNAFRAPNFTLGQIPEFEPPVDLRQIG